MCLLLLTLSHPDYDLILLSNRDEFFARPTSVIKQYAVNPTTLSLTIEPRTSSAPIPIISGRDVERGGTWLALSTDGKFSALTNFHVKETPPKSPISRGHLPLSFLCTTLRARQYAEALVQDDRITQVGGFSLLCGDLRRLDDGIICVGNQSRTITTLLQRSARKDSSETKTMETQGIVEDNGDVTCACELSNADISTPWPKTQLGKTLLRECVDQSVHQMWSEDKLIDELIKVLCNDTYTTGDVAGMRQSIFIPRVQVRDDWYGTRQQTVWLVKSDKVKIIEETIEVNGQRRRAVIDHGW